MYYFGTLCASELFLITWIKWILGQILNGIFMFLGIFNIEYLAICIIVFTILVRALMIPLTIKQQKFTKLSQVMQPEIKAIQEKYKNKKDQEPTMKMNRETMAVYEKYGTSPTSGCLTSLITLPIMLALYRVMYNIPEYIPSIGKLYNQIADSMTGVDGYAKTVASYVKDLNDKRITFKASGDKEALINALKNFKTDNWKDLAELFKDNAESYNIITKNSGKIIHYSKFVGGLNIMDSPSDKPWPGLIIPILAVLTQWYSMKQIQAKTTNNSNQAPDPTQQSMQMMSKVMPLFSGVLCYTFPIAIGIYWITGSVFVIVQQYFVERYMNKMDIDEFVQMNKEKAANKKKQAGLWEKLMQAGENAKNAQEQEETNKKSISELAKVNYKNISDEDIKYESKKSDNKNGQMKISDYANILNSKNK
ncbi:MAG: YidC/Oxa1 family membrane protein insertase [Lachnospiraceae bacterium]|nr:YidC/Oxa1 family membrane protein insertase [Lachnospiraceae bacterium]